MVETEHQTRRTTGRQIHEKLKLDISAEDGTGLIRCCQSGPMIVRACYLLCEEQLGGMCDAFGKADGQRAM